MGAARLSSVTTSGCWPARCNGVARERSARIVTKGGMTRAGGAWVPDGRAKAILGDCEASLAALTACPIDVYLIHSPDPRTPWRTSVRALARLVDDGVVKRIGLSNVNRRQLDEALELAPITAVEVALSLIDDRALRGGIVERCAELGIAVIAHSPLGGPRRAGGLARRRPLVDVARRHGVTPAEVALAWLLELSPAVIAIPGARRPETARGAAARGDAPPRRRGPSGPPASALPAGSPPRIRRAAGPAGRRARTTRKWSWSWGSRGPGRAGSPSEYVARGYVRLNRDERGGGLRELAETLDAGAVVGRSAGRPRQHVPVARGAQLRDRGGGPTPDPDEVHLARARRSRKPRSTSSSACSSSSGPSRPPKSCDGWRGAPRAC